MTRFMDFLAHLKRVVPSSSHHMEVDSPSSISPTMELTPSHIESLSDEEIQEEDKEYMVATRAQMEKLDIDSFGFGCPCPLCSLGTLELHNSYSSSGTWWRCDKQVYFSFDTLLVMSFICFC